MIRIEIEMSIPTSSAVKGDPILDAALAIGVALSENPIDGMMIHSIRVEQEDA